MLRQLTIKNYALIDLLEMNLDEGLTIITGETGAGKSIMLGAMALLRGERADSRVVADKGKKSVVEAFFTGVPVSLRDLFTANDLDWNDGDVIVRREISASGRGRAFINDVPVTVALLASVTVRLLDIHSQHGNIKLVSPENQLDIIDTIAGNKRELEEYKECFHRFVRLRNRIRQCKADIEKARENREFLQFQYENVEKLKPKRGELAEIEIRFDILGDADELREKLAYTIGLLGDNGGALSRLTDAKAALERIDEKVFGENAGSMIERLDQCCIELRDINASVVDALENITCDPDMMARLSSRMNKYYEVMRYFHVSTGDELCDISDDLKKKLDAIETGGEELPELEKEGRRLARLLKEKADLLTDSRIKGAREFEKMVNEKASPLGLANLDFKVTLETGKLTATGQDRLEFLCAFNKNQTPMPLSKAASGGELSRLMLTIEDIIAGKMQLPTVILDEIDTGVSGDIADRMGNMMREMSHEMQVIAITHLPQVAAKGTDHFKVYKEDNDNKTVSFVKHLDDDARIREIAGMMSGSTLTESAMDNARSLLGKTQ